ncbi:hypothetical protein [Xanthobacter versatilis]|uniref:hypothetical protein n=1 Tax=Xanthobacter autotrophicus (strain ATCC BAA-1158 / Py2) TaxID=78245 RepID=UPI003728DDBF
MASDDPKAEGFASRPSRTPPTLDLKAEEVATASGAPGATPASDTGAKNIPAPGTGAPQPGTDPKAAGTAGKPADTKPVEAKPVEARPAPSMPVEPKAADPKPSTTPSTGPKLSDAKPSEAKPSEAKAAGSKPGEASSESAPAAAAKASTPVPPAPAPARSGNGGAVFAGLIAGIIGGGAVAGGLWYALPQFFPAPAPVVEPAPVVNLTPLQNRIAAIEARPAFDPRAIAALSERLERSEATLKSLEATVAALKSTPAPTSAAAPSPTQAQAPAAAVSPALLKTVDDLKASSEATRDALATARRDIEALRTVESNLHTAVAAATAGAQQAGAQAQAQVQALAQSLTPKVEAVGPRLDALKAQIEEATAAATAFNRAAAGLVVLSTFRDAVVSGRPFATELAAARTTLGPAAGQLDPFAPAAATGYAAPAKLAATLAQQGAAAIAAERPAPAPVDSSASLVDRMLSSAESLVKVRPVTGPGSVDLEGLIATAVSQVKAGQLDDALITLKKLPDPVQARLAVIREIEARTAAVRVAGTLYQQQLAAISRKVP